LIAALVPAQSVDRFQTEPVSSNGLGLMVLARWSIAIKLGFRTILAPAAGDLAVIGLAISAVLTAHRAVS